jgi:hypothetical protein
MYECVWSIGGMTLTGKTEVLGEKRVTVPLGPSQISHELTWDRTRTSVVRGRRLTAWAMVLPWFLRFIHIDDLWLINLRRCGWRLPFKAICWHLPRMTEESHEDGQVLLYHCLYWAQRLPRTSQELLGDTKTKTREDYVATSPPCSNTGVCNNLGYSDSGTCDSFVLCFYDS